MIANVKKKASTENRIGFLLVLPAMLVFTAIIFYPFLQSLSLSFTDKSMLSPSMNFTGITNFISLFKDPNFYEIFKNTLIFVAGGTLLPFLLAFAWSIVLNEGFRGEKLLRTLTLVCWVIPSTSIGLLWIWMFNGNYGVINAFMQHLGLISKNITFMGRPDTAMIAVIIAKTWQTLPWFMAFLLGGLQSAPQDQAEAVKMDGGNNWTVMRHVIMPHMKSLVYIILILGVIGSFQQFDLVWVMTQGGPARSTTTLAVEVYRRAFESYDIGGAAAVGMVWVLLLSIFAVMYVRSMKDKS
ncbi:ABC transporter permease subunit [Paenibacillus sp. LMG 31461]|uniref:ABC transporter permease subunit n=1 Tax=Paenibacillus plantarum TaxID=2654975 RepID=A0ABX1X268_9BACL|nr:sugar ABC transporter permease [Paenibacillus plantarum]NOU62502.1 ABC transporter permease subunit [Paenibacillus plantarum]